jgi:hypothetical protein
VRTQKTEAYIDRGTHLGDIIGGAVLFLVALTALGLAIRAYRNNEHRNNSERVSNKHKLSRITDSNVHPTFHEVLIRRGVHLVRVERQGEGHRGVVLAAAVAVAAQGGQVAQQTELIVLGGVADLLRRLGVGGLLVVRARAALRVLCAKKKGISM